MHCIALLQSTPDDPDVAVVLVSDQEHDELHKDAKGFINRNKVFRKDVTAVEALLHAPDAATAKAGTKKPAQRKWMLTLVHLPSCVVRGSCYQV